MKNLGRIYLLLVSFVAISYAGVVASVEPAVIYKGDSATYTLTISGEDAKKPVINDICGNSITSTSSRTSIQMINGDYKKSYILGYGFEPSQSCTIDGVEVEIDGKLQKANPVKVEVKPVSQTLNGDFVLSLEASKTDLFVGEPFELTLLLKQRRNADVVDSKFIAPTMKGFWKKSESNPVRYNDGNYIVTKMTYELAAQREGNLTITPAQLRVAKRVGVNNWGSLIPQVKWRSYFSNGVDIDVKPIPNKAKLVGNFTINAIVDKKEINANEALNVTVIVKGDGNFEDIESFKPYIAGVNVFDEKTKVDKNGFSQKLAFVSDNNFTIPPFELAFYNLKTQRVEKIKTKPIDIVVHGSTAKPNQTPTLNIKRAKEVTNDVVVPTKKEVVVETNKLYIFLAFVVGLALGGVLMSLKGMEFRSKTKNRVNIKDEKLLLIKLLPYKDDPKVKKIVDTLESNIYSSNKQKLDKKELKEILQKYDID